MSRVASSTEGYDAMIDALFATLDGARVLNPDVELDALTAQARREAHACLDEHASALALFGDEPRETSVEVQFTRSRSALRLAWARAFEPPDGSTLWWGRATQRARGAGWRDDPTTRALLLAAGLTHFGPLDDAGVDVMALDQRLRRACAALRVRSGLAEGASLPVEQLYGLELAWRLGPRAGDPSPWAPLCALWERGAWPVYLAMGRWLLYVPHRRRDGALLDEGDEGPVARAPDEYRVRAHAASSLVELGVGPAGRWHGTRRAWLVEHARGRAMPVTTRLTLGRSASDDVQASLEHDDVAKLHARIERVGDDEFFVEDLSAPGGTLQNQRRIAQRAPLSDGDTLALGSCSLRFYLEPEPEPESPTLEAPGVLCLLARDATTR